MVDIPAQDDPRIFIPIPVPVKGRKQPIVLRLPRFDFIDEDTFDAMQAGLDAIDVEHADLPMRKRGRMIVLRMLQQFVPQRDLEACESLTVGQLDAVLEEWRNKSSISLGEYLASVNSSTGNTEAPCGPTSSGPVTAAKISGAA